MVHGRRRTAAAVVAAGVAAALVGCSGHGSGGTTLTGQPVVTHHPHHTAGPSATPSISASPLPTATVTVTASPTTPSTPTSPQNLAVTPAVRKQLVAAGAASHQLPASDFTGLVPGLTYYAYDPAHATYWAGAGLVPSSASEDAQISVQDDGSYLIFKRHGTASWTAYNVGLAGIAGATCPVRPPAAITAIWHWTTGSCRPPS